MYSQNRHHQLLATLLLPPEVKHLEELIQQFIPVHGLHTASRPTTMTLVPPVAVLTRHTVGMSTGDDSGWLVQQLVAELTLEVLDYLDVVFLQVLEEHDLVSVYLELLSLSLEVLPLSTALFQLVLQV